MYFSGQHGKLEVSYSYGGAYYPVGSLKNWSYTTQQQTLDTTSLADTDKTLINGVRTTTGQASLLYYEETGNSNVDLLGSRLVKTGQANNPEADDYGTRADQPQKVLIKLSLPGGAAGTDKRTVAMWAFITSFAMTCSVGEVVSADISWESIGAPFEWDY